MGRELVTGGGISEAVRRRYGIEENRPVSSIAPDLFSVLDMSDRGMPPDLRLLAGQSLCSGGSNVTGSILNQAAVSLTNPAGSGVIMVVEQVQMASLDSYVTMRSILESELPTPAGTRQGVILDGRTWTPSSGGACTSRRSVGRIDYYTSPTGPEIALSCEFARPVGAAVQELGALVKNTMHPWTIPIVLTPGTSIWVVTGTIDSELYCYFQWRERKMESWENQSL